MHKVYLDILCVQCATLQLRTFNFVKYLSLPTFIDVKDINYMHKKDTTSVTRKIRKKSKIYFFFLECKYDQQTTFEAETFVLLPLKPFFVWCSDAES